MKTKMILQAALKKKPEDMVAFLPNLSRVKTAV